VDGAAGGGLLLLPAEGGRGLRSRQLQVHQREAGVLPPEQGISSPQLTALATNSTSCKCRMYDTHGYVYIHIYIYLNKPKNMYIKRSPRNCSLCPKHFQLRKIYMAFVCRSLLPKPIVGGGGGGFAHKCLGNSPLKQFRMK
jgi:hypothetical protein